MSAHGRQRQAAPSGRVAACFSWDGASEPTPQRGAQQSSAPAAEDPKRQELETYISQAIAQYKQLTDEGRNEEAGQIGEEIQHLTDMLQAMPAPAAQPPASTGRSAAPANSEEAAASFHAAKNQREQAMAKNR